MEIVKWRPTPLEEIGIIPVDPDTVRSLSFDQLDRDFSAKGLYSSALYARLQDSLQQIDRDQAPEIIWTTSLALSIHAKDTRILGRYIDHLMRSTLYVVEDFGITDVETIAAQPIHDIVEKHAIELVYSLSGMYITDEGEARERAYGLIANLATPTVAQIVSEMTNPLQRPDITEQEKVTQYLEKIQAMTTSLAQTRNNKTGDMLDNTSDLERLGNLADQMYRYRRYLQPYEIVNGWLNLPDNMIRRQAKRRTRRLLIARHAIAATALGLPVAA